MSQNILQTLMPQVYYVFWKLSAFADWRNNAAYTRLLLQNCMEKFKKFHSQKPPHSTLVHHIFVTRKITLAAARIAQGYQDKLYLGNLNSLRDWGYAKDYIECMWLILQQPEPDDFVIATGEYHTVREFATLAFKEAGIELEWRGDGIDEKGYDKATGKILVEVDPKYFRPAEVDQLLGNPAKAKAMGNPAKAKAKLGWDPQKTSFPNLVKIMVQHDMKFVKKLFLKAQMPE